MISVDAVDQAATMASFRGLIGLGGIGGLQETPHHIPQLEKGDGVVL
jgi:hypothetical protein